MTLTAPFPWFGVIECDTEGHVWRISANGRPVRRRIDAPDCSKGYRNVVLPFDGRWRTFKAHRIIWWYFNGEIPAGVEVNHRNLVKDDNRLSNLELLTPAGNIQHSYANGRTLPWSTASEWRAGRQRVSPEAKQAIARMRADGATLREVADAHGISTSHVHRIASSQEVGNGVT